MKIILEITDVLPERDQVVFLAKALSEDNAVIQACELYYTVKSSGENVFKQAAKEFNASLLTLKQHIAEHRSLLLNSTLQIGTTESFEEKDLLLDLDDTTTPVALYTPAQEEFIKQKIVAVLDDLGYFDNEKSR